MIAVNKHVGLWPTYRNPPIFYDKANGMECEDIWKQQVVKDANMYSVPTIARAFALIFMMKDFS